MMDKELQTYKRTLRAFMREHYTDERLTWLLAHARSGRLAYDSCCCFIGIVNAPHALIGAGRSAEGWDSPGPGFIWHHMYVRETLPGADEAEDAYSEMGFKSGVYSDEVRRRRLIPIIKAEVKRRDSLKAQGAHSIGALAPSAGLTLADLRPSAEEVVSGEAQASPV